MNTENKAEPDYLDMWQLEDGRVAIGEQGEKAAIIADPEDLADLSAFQ